MQAYEGAVNELREKILGAHRLNRGQVISAEVDVSLFLRSPNIPLAANPIDVPIYRLSETTTIESRDLSSSTATSTNGLYLKAILRESAQKHEPVKVLRVARDYMVGESRNLRDVMLCVSLISAMLLDIDLATILPPYCDVGLITPVMNRIRDIVASLKVTYTMTVVNTLGGVLVHVSPEWQYDLVLFARAEEFPSYIGCKQHHISALALYVERQLLREGYPSIPLYSSVDTPINGCTYASRDFGRRSVFEWIESLGSAPLTISLSDSSPKFVPANGRSSCWDGDLNGLFIRGIPKLHALDTIEATPSGPIQRSTTCISLFIECDDHNSARGVMSSIIERMITLGNADRPTFILVGLFNNAGEKLVIPDGVNDAACYINLVQPYVAVYGGRIGVEVSIPIQTQTEIRSTQTTKWRTYGRSSIAVSGIPDSSSGPSGEVSLTTYAHQALGCLTSIISQSLGVRIRESNEAHFIYENGAGSVQYADSPQSHLVVDSSTYWMATSTGPMLLMAAIYRTTGAMGLLHMLPSLSVHYVLSHMRQHRSIHLYDLDVERLREGTLNKSDILNSCIQMFVRSLNLSEVHMAFVEDPSIYSRPETSHESFLGLGAAIAAVLSGFISCRAIKGHMALVPYLTFSRISGIPICSTPGISLSGMYETYRQLLKKPPSLVLPVIAGNCIAQVCGALTEVTYKLQGHKLDPSIFHDPRMVIGDKGRMYRSALVNSKLPSWVDMAFYCNYAYMVTTPLMAYTPEEAISRLITITELASAESASDEDRDTAMGYWIYYVQMSLYFITLECKAIIDDEHAVSIIMSGFEQANTRSIEIA